MKEPNKKQKEKLEQLEYYIKVMTKQQKFKSELLFAQVWKVSLLKQMQEDNSCNKDEIRETIRWIDYIVQNRGGEHPSKVILAKQGQLDTSKFYNRFVSECLDKVDESCIIVNMPKGYTDYAIISNCEGEFIVCVVNQKLKYVLPFEKNKKENE